MSALLPCRERAPPVSQIVWALNSFFRTLITSWRTYPLLAFSIAFPLVPLWFGWRRRRALTPALRWVMVYLALTFLEDHFAVFWARGGRHNLWVSNLYTPVELFILAMVFAGWQLRERWVTVIRITALVFAVWWGVMMLTVESLFSFARFTRPVEALLVITVAAWTLVQRTRHTVSPLTLHPWFWVSAGALLYFAYTLLLTPVSFILLSSSAELVRLAFSINALLVIVMYLCWLRAFLLVPVPPRAGATE